MWKLLTWGLADLPQSRYRKVTDMSRVYSSALIRQPVDLVFNYVTTPGNWPRWLLSSLAVTGATNHSPRVGEQVIEEFRIAGRLGRAVWTVVECVEPTRWVIAGEVVGNRNGGRVVFSFHPHGQGATLFERQFFYEPRKAVQRLADHLFIRTRIARESAEAMARLRERLEELGANPSVSMETR
jgi:hypothetical protein